MASKNQNEDLKRVMGLSGFSLNIVNITIGAGIFVLPAIVGVQLGAYSIYAYLFCGFMMACIMLCYAEIGTRVTTSGGSYAYVTAAFGDFAGYIISWLSVFGWSILGSAALMNIIADSLAGFFPALSIRWVRAIFFLVLLSFLALTNIRGAKQGVTFVKWISIIKLLPLIAIVIFGFAFINMDNLRFDALPSFKSFASTCLVLFFAFAGFETALGASGEIKNPRRTIPLGILIGGGIILLLYVLLQITTVGLLGSQMVDVQDAPLAAVANKIVGSIGGTLLLIAAAISCYGAVSTDVMGTPRVLYAGAVNGDFPNFLAKVHPKFSTPYWSIVCFVGMLFVFSVSGGFEQLAALASAAILLIYLFVIAAMIKMRLNKQKEDHVNVFKVPGGLVIPCIGIGTIIWLLTSLSKWEVLSTIVFISLVSGLYFLSKILLKKSIA